MRKLSVNAFLTLDGVMQAPGGPDEDRSGGFAHGGWSATFWDEMMGATMGAMLAQPFDMLLGRKTYEIFAAHWPHADESEAQVFNDAIKHVASRTLTSLGWRNSRLIAGDVATGVARLKQADGPELQVQGSSDLVQTLLAAQLVDELRLWVFPVVVGGGKRLFGTGTLPQAFSLVESATSTTGVTMSIYRTAGAVPLGSFALEEPSPAEVERRRGLAEAGRDR